MPDFDSLPDDALIQAFTESEELASEVESLKEKLTKTRYSDTKLSGQGGAKKVYLSRDLISGRDLARAYPINEALEEDFLREAQLHSLLEHPNIIPLYDIGYENGKPFFTMKYIEGQNLEDFVNSKRSHFSDSHYQNEVLDIFLKICDAVRYAHSRGILHLDLKPANVQLSQFGEVLVGDWGLARVQSAPSIDNEYDNSAASGQFTRYGLLNGTPGFMAPEQCQKGQEKTPASDIYSLGAILVYMLSGEEIVEGNSDEKINATSLGLLSFDFAKIPNGLQSFIRMTLALKKEDRYPDVDAMIKDINAYRTGYLTSADERSTSRLLKALYKRKRKVFYASSFVAIILLGLTSIFILSLQKSEERARNSEQKTLLSRQQLQGAFDQLNQVKEERENLAQEFASDYLKQGVQYYYTRDRGRYKYYPTNDKRAFSLVSKALTLNDSNPEAWALKGRTAMLTNRFAEAAEAFAKAGEEFSIHRQICLNFQDRDSRDVYTLIEILKELRKVEDLRLIHDFMFKTIFSKLALDKQIYFIEESLNIRNEGHTQRLNFAFDEENWSLDLSSNPNLRYIFMIKNLPLREINFSRTAISNDFYHIEKMPLVKADVSFSLISNSTLKFFRGKPIRELSLRGCSISQLKPLEHLPLEVLDIRATKVVDFSILSHITTLKKVICDQQQYANLIQTFKGREGIITIEK